MLGVQTIKINQRKSEHRPVGEENNIKTVFKIILNVIGQACYRNREQTGWGRGTTHRKGGIQKLMCESNYEVFADIQRQVIQGGRSRQGE